MIALVDCNSFYASCERVFRPDLHNRPIVVLSNNDGCIIAMDRNAKICGIKRGAPYFQVRADLAAIDAAVFSSNYTLYQDISLRVMEILRQHCTGIEVYSIDEAFLFLEECCVPFSLLGKNIHRDILQCTGIPVSIGFGRTKTLAKIANKWAKTQTAGLFILKKEYEENILSQINIMDVWGIGPRKASFLFARGVRTARELRDLPDYWVKKNLTLVTLRTVWELRGIQSIDPENSYEPKKMILSSLGFSSPICNLPTLENAVSLYAATAVRKLIQQQSEASGVIVFIKTHRHKKPYYSGSREIRLQTPTSYLPEIAQAAILGLHQVYRKGFNYTKAGVCLFNIDTSDRYQYDLFQSSRMQKRAVSKTVMEIQKKFGAKAITSGRTGASGEWYMKRSRLSPKYTTRWSEIPTVK